MLSVMSAAQQEFAVGRSGKSITAQADDNTLKLFRANADQYNRTRGTRATLVEISEEERQELQEIWDALVGPKGMLDASCLLKAADAVFGKGNYNPQNLKKALTRMDLSKTGKVDWFDFRAYMSINYWSASKDAHTILTQNKDMEDMILVDGNMRLADMLRAYRRRAMVDNALKAAPAIIAAGRAGKPSISVLPPGLQKVVNGKADRPRRSTQTSKPSEDGEQPGVMDLVEEYEQYEQQQQEGGLPPRLSVQQRDSVGEYEAEVLGSVEMSSPSGRVGGSGPGSGPASSNTVTGRTSGAPTPRGVSLIQSQAPASPRFSSSRPSSAARMAPPGSILDTADESYDAIEINEDSYDTTLTLLPVASTSVGGVPKRRPSRLAAASLVEDEAEEFLYGGSGSGVGGGRAPSMSGGMLVSPPEPSATRINRDLASMVSPNSISGGKSKSNLFASSGAAGSMMVDRGRNPPSGRPSYVGMANGFKSEPASPSAVALQAAASAPEPVVSRGVTSSDGTAGKPHPHPAASRQGSRHLPGPPQEEDSVFGKIGKMFGRLFKSTSSANGAAAASAVAAVDEGPSARGGNKSGKGGKGHSNHSSAMAFAVEDDVPSTAVARSKQSASRKGQSNMSFTSGNSRAGGARPNKGGAASAAEPVALDIPGLRQRSVTQMQRAGLMMQMPRAG